MRLSFPWLGDNSIVGYIGHSVYYMQAQDFLDIDKSVFQWFAAGNMETHKVYVSKWSKNKIVNYSGNI